ncbi:MAG TPA: right-handed parallel beta-helix repeat-containing protein [Longimicrobium sp.]|nr:right-handed parallel beta-helix repeat-containing protein [Longimicrobium sp.]
MSQELLTDRAADVFDVRLTGAAGDTCVITGARNGQGQPVRGGSITAGSDLLSVLGGAFTAADEGKVISVAGAGAPVAEEATLYGIPYRPPRNNLGATVEAVLGPTQVRLSACAQTTVAAADVTWGTDDTAAIQLALDNNADVYLPLGRYTLTAPLRIARGSVSLHGAGPHLSVLTGSVGLEEFLLCMSYMGQVIEDVQISDVGFDGRPDRLHTLAVDVVDARDLTVRGVSGTALEGFLGLRNTSNWMLAEFDTADTVDTISLYRSGEGTISNGRILQANEGIDFFGATDVAVSDVVITSQPHGQHPGIYQVGMDVSSSKRITCSNVTVRGDFMRAVHVKQEEDPAPAVQEVLFTGCEFLDFSQMGVYVTAGAPAPPGEAGVPNRGLRLEGCTFRSAVPGAAGIYMATSAANEFREVRISACTIEVPHQAVRNCDHDGVEIHGCLLRVSGAAPAVYVSGVAGVLLAGCEVHGGSGSGLELVGVRDPRVEGCTVTAAGSALVLLDCLRPVVRGNVVREGARTGIYLLWNGTGGLDAANHTVGAVVDENRVQNWGAGTTGTGGIEVRFTNVAGTYSALSVSGNRLLLDAGSPAATQQVGILFSRGGLDSIDWVKADNNLIYGPVFGIGNEADLGPHSTLSNNSFKAGLP